MAGTAVAGAARALATDVARDRDRYCFRCRCY